MSNEANLEEVQWEQDLEKYGKDAYKNWEGCEENCVYRPLANNNEWYFATQVNRLQDSGD
jgi:hypothetical protein